MKLLWLAAPAALALTPVSALAATSCENLASVALPNAKVDKAEAVAAGSVAVPGGGGRAVELKGLPAFCRVAATLTPSADSDIKVELWLPATGWNGKLEAEGNGGWGGTISYPALADALKRGYAAASTDTGHSTPGGSFIQGHPEKLVDYDWRSEHEMVVKAKALVQAYYASAPKRSYFNGCSTGGKQALMEAARFPDDLDAIVAGDPANLHPYRNTWQIWALNQIHKEPAGVMDRAKLAMLHQAVLDACDGLDGVKDGLIENPKACRFDPATLPCKGGETAQCLTPPQVEAARTLFSPGRANGREYNPGLERGSEMGWSLWTSATSDPQQSDFFKYVVFKDPNLDWKSLNPDTALPAAVAADKEGGAEAKDLTAFYRHGGKIVMYQGWADPTVAPQATLNYYQAMMQASPRAAAQTRIFFVPGMGHCRGGEGATDRFDAVAALDTWVEKDQAPARILAANIVEGKTTRSRPLCAYPQAAHYTGTGSSDDAANFVCKAP